MMMLMTVMIAMTFGAGGCGFIRVFGSCFGLAGL